MSFHLAHANVEEPDSASLTAETIAEVLAVCEVATFNEAGEPETHRTLRSYSTDWGVYIPKGNADENCIMWQRHVFRHLESGSRIVMRGGVVSGHRRGPSRGVSWVVLEERTTGKRFILATHHAIAKADTSALWRRGLRTLGFENTASVLHRVMDRHPHAELILTGDMNTKGRVEFPGLPVIEVRTPPTMGAKRYDRILTTGCVDVHRVHAFRTNSDHKALVASVHLAQRWHHVD